LLAFSTFTASAPYVAMFLLAIIGVWIAATRVLGKQFALLTDPEQQPFKNADAGHRDRKEHILVPEV
nr:hypothetical protein [Parachlamydiaceae bacterium]